MARNFTDKSVALLKPKAKLYVFPDPQLPGHYVRVMPTGIKSYCTIARDPKGKQVWTTLGKIHEFNLEHAREEARKALQRTKRVGPMSFQVVAEEWLKRHVEEKGLRSDYEYRRMLNKHVFPVWGNRDIGDIDRERVTALQDNVQDEHGTRTSDKVLSLVGTIFAFHQKRTSSFTSPIVTGMKRYSSKENARKRILTDDEIRSLWRQQGTYADLLKLCLLTGQRREKVATMRWSDLAGNVWTIPTEEREKGNAGELRLPPMAMQIIKRQPKLNAFVFAGRGGGHFASWKQRDKIERDGWTVHDLRRTARSLMSRARILPHVGEQVLGHAIKGVEGTYDRHDYREEKGHALKALAALVQSIITPPTDKVVLMTRVKTKNSLVAPQFD
jgi:integrase